MAAIASTSMVGKERDEKEWKTLSTEWRQALTSLLNTVDAVNKNRAELDRQKEMIRMALTQGRFDIIERERAVELYKQWNRGIQMIPIYPEDYVPVSSNPVRAADDGGEHVKLYSLDDEEGGEEPPAAVLPPIKAYMYELDEGVLAKRDWIQVAPPDLLKPANVIIAGPDVKVVEAHPIPGPTNRNAADDTYSAVDAYPIRGVADWRVRPLLATEQVVFDETLVIQPAGPPPAVVSQTVNQMIRASGVDADAYQFQFRYKPIIQSFPQQAYQFVPARLPQKQPNIPIQQQFQRIYLAEEIPKPPELTQEEIDLLPTN